MECTRAAKPATPSKHADDTTRAIFQNFHRNNNHAFAAGKSALTSSSSHHIMICVTMTMLLPSCFGPQLPPGENRTQEEKKDETLLGAISISSSDFAVSALPLRLEQLRHKMMTGWTAAEMDDDSLTTFQQQQSLRGTNPVTKTTSTTGSNRALEADLSPSHMSGLLRNEARIVGGYMAHKNRYPYYTTSLWHCETQFCVGSLVDKEWMLKYCFPVVGHILVNDGQIYW